MSHEYLRCPVCGKISKLVNFQIHNIGGHHRFPDVMVQEIYSAGRGKIRNKWHSAKLNWKTEQELNQIFKEILSQVLAGVLNDIEEVVGVEDEDEKIRIETEEEIEKEEKKKKKQKDKIFEVEDEVGDEIFGVEGAEDKILDEIFSKAKDETFEVEDEDEVEVEGEDEFFQSRDDESLDEETFRVF